MDKKTKERIVEAAIDLFSKKGFEAVSMQDIAREVGIKKASIYSHFESKEQLMDTILQHFMYEFSRPAKLDYGNAGLLKANGFEGIMYNGWQEYARRMKDPTMQKIFRIINFEQHRNKAIRDFYIRLIMEGPIESWEELFSRMVENKVFKQCDPKMMALEFYGVCVYIYVRFFLLEPETTYDSFMSKADPLMAKHISIFYEANKA